MKRTGGINFNVGCLLKKDASGRYYWQIRNDTDGDHGEWKEIPKYLYDALIKHEKECRGRNGKNEQ